MLTMLVTQTTERLPLICLHVKWRSFQLEQQTVAFSSSLNHRSRVHGLSSGSQGGTLAQESAG